MVTSNKLPEKKIVKMSTQNNVSVIPQRTLLGEVNEQITCPLCRGYYIDATTIVECLHSFCRSCIIKHLQVKSYCPVCEMMINSAKPNIKLDKALQDIVYKLVPGLFQKEMERRQQFYASRPGPAACATPEQRGEDTERIIFSPEDVISFSLEYADMTDADSISSKSSDSNEPQPTTGATRRFLQCPAVVNISHLKKFLSMKFDIDSTQFAIDILYKRVPLPDYYTLMDIAYIYNWKRNEPMRFFYQIIDYVAIRSRFFDINRKDSHFQDRKSSPTLTEDTNAASPAPNLHEQASETSSGAESPMPDDNSLKQTDDLSKKPNKNIQTVCKDGNNQEIVCVNKPSSVLVSKKNDEDVEKSQFLNSFELTAKSNSNNTHTKSPSPHKPKNVEEPAQNEKASLSMVKIDESLKRKQQQASTTTPELKKLRIELERSNLITVSPKKISETSSPQNVKTVEQMISNTKSEGHLKIKQTTATTSSNAYSSAPSKETKQQITNIKVSDSSNLKKPVPSVQNNVSSNSVKRKTAVDALATNISTSMPQPQKTVSPLKLQIPKADTTNPKGIEIQKGSTKKIPDLKPSSLIPHTTQSKLQTVNKVRMDLLANNSDPTIDRSKILSQVKTSMCTQSNNQNSGDSLKSIFDSCNINIPSSLSITLTDQKLDPRNATDVLTTDQKKLNIVNKNLAGASSNASHKVPSPPVHNYIEILKLPDADIKKVNKNDSNSEIMALLTKSDSNSPQTKIVKASETSAKGPIPNLKPISDTKLGKQVGNFSAPITFQQTFEQQLQAMQSDKKSKVQKAKSQVPKLVPAQKVFNVGNKSSIISNKPTVSNILPEPKPSSALDLSTAHNLPSQVGTQQNFDKALETMQTIANLAKKQNLPSKSLPLTISQSSTFSGAGNRPINTSANSSKLPPASNINHMKMDKTNAPHTNIGRPDIPKNIPLKSGSNSGPNMSSNYALSSHNSSSSTTQPSPRSQTRSPSCSPKLVIAEDKQSSSAEQNINQLNVSSQNINTLKTDSSKISSNISKPGLKSLKPQTPATKVPGGIRPPMNVNSPVMNTSPDYLPRPQLISTPRHLLSQMDMNAWLKLQRQFNFDFIKSMSTMAHQTQNDYNKDKQQ